MPLASSIEIETPAGVHTLPLPNEYEWTYYRPSVVGLNAAGKPFIQPLITGDPHINGDREFTLTWAVLTDAQLATLRSAWDGLTSGVNGYQDIEDVDFAVVRHPDQKTLEAIAVKVAGGWRWSVTLHLIQTSALF